MAEKLQPVRGTHDWLEADHRKFRFVVDTARAVAERYGFSQVDTPIFEFTEVFHRTLGDTSDVVTKETYTFADRGGESLTLRPEFTAAIARAFVSNGLQQNLPCKFFYAGPAFRYERPQKGRMRQFHQIGAEVFGVESPLMEAEVIALAHDLLKAFAIESVTLEINTLGDPQSRMQYRDALVAYFSAHAASLSDDSKKRLEKNPLRILDSKDEGDRKLISHAPRLDAHLTPEAKAHFDEVKHYLDALSIPYQINDRLVRGLDYYSHTVFEFTSTALGAQNTVLAGGRYNDLVEQMGGPSVPGIGWAAGIERLVNIIAFEAHPCFKPATRPIALVPVEHDGDHAALFALAHRLRAEGFTVDLVTKGKDLGKRLANAAKHHACAAVMVNADPSLPVDVKNMDTREQTAVLREKLVDALSQFRQ